MGNSSKLAELTYTDEETAKGYVQDYQEKYLTMMDMIRAGSDTTELGEEMTNIEYDLLDSVNL